MTSFEFGTKAETLERFRPFLTKCEIPASYYFSVSDWKKEPQEVIAAIRSCFDDGSVIVRSSAIAEDSKVTAMAGAFLSIPDVPLRDQSAMRHAINEVINSYEQEAGSDNNQVLVQSMINNASASGVIFTQDLNTGAPYYVINYDDETGRTDTIASGSGYCNRTLLVHRDSWDQLHSERFLALLHAVEEIECVSGSSSLDIEFAMDDANKVYLFQVRHITTKPNWNRGITLRVNDMIHRLRDSVKHLASRREGIRGSRSILGLMPDWNPAEIIGSTPHPLSLSLYRYLITDKTWRIARRQMGYAEPVGMPLMQSLGGQPYIDVQLSFHSYLPEDLPEKIGDKLVNAWLDRLENNPQFHDKIEFDVAITVWALDFDKRVEDLIPGILTADEMDCFKQSLLRLTNRILSGQVASLDEQLEKIALLEKKRDAILAEVSEPGMAQVNALLDDCIEFGTIPFSVLARYGFISHSFLMSMVNIGILDESDVERFKLSVPTVAGEFIRDLERYESGEVSQEYIMTRYGHLRPGTYDIRSIRYDQRGTKALSFNQNIAAEKNPADFTLSDAQSDQLEQRLKKQGFEIGADELLVFMKRSIQAREYAKFVFTRNVSDALEIIKGWGERIGLNVNEISYIDIRDILDSMAVSKGRTQEDYLRQLSETGRRDFEITSALRLPHLIRDESDLVIVPLILDQPNFITNKTVRGECMLITGMDSEPELLDGKIVVIENADPGFDWIFARPIKALVTKFGGANSHMAIRCAEFGLPAAIGCGEQIFDRVIKSHTVELNCTQGRIIPLHS